MKQLLKVMPLLALMLGACGTELRKNETNAFHLERVKARVIRLDCEGEVASDRTEEVSEPSQWVNIESDSNTYEISHATLKNMSLKPDSNDGMKSYHPHRVSFLIHYSDTWLGYQVKSGINEFYYEFFSEEGTQMVSQESGTIKLDITYSERFDNELREIEATPEECVEEGGP